MAIHVGLAQDRARSQASAVVSARRLSVGAWTSASVGGLLIFMTGAWHSRVPAQTPAAGGTGLGRPRSAAAGARARLTTLSTMIALLVTALPAGLTGQSLRGSTASLDRQNRQAHRHDFTFIRTPAQVQRFVDAGYLVPVLQGPDHELHRLSFPYARPEVKLFISRLAAQYRQACGEKLVVTSLTRPKNRQPRNASPRSVHPTGMALDLRRPAGKCRAWLERVLLQLEGSGVLEATLERWPPHYHIALYPQPYSAYVERLASAAGSANYEVQPGDSLWMIAQRYSTTVPRIRSANNLSSSRIYPGQVLTVPAP